jgi:Leucine-rich repeat (LRR) protein
VYANNLTETKEAVTLFSHFTQLKRLQIYRTPLRDLSCLRLMPALEHLSISMSTQRMHSSDIEHVYALTQLQSLRIEEEADDRVLLTESALAALQVPSPLLPRLTEFIHQ